MVTMISPPTGLTHRPNLAYNPRTSGDILSEKVLIGRCKSGDASAWDTLIRRYQTPVEKFAYSLCRNSEEMGDIAGLVFLRLYQNLNSFRCEASFISWLFRIVRNTYHDLCVRATHRNDLSLDADSTRGSGSQAAWEIPDPAPSPETICVERETSQILAIAIDHLPAYQSRVMHMYAEGKSYKEIAQEIGLSIGTVKSRLNRARTMLRERLAPFQKTLMAA